MITMEYYLIASVFRQFRYECVPQGQDSMLPDIWIDCKCQFRYRDGSDKGVVREQQNVIITDSLIREINNVLEMHERGAAVGLSYRRFISDITRK